MDEAGQHRAGQPRESERPGHDQRQPRGNEQNRERSAEADKAPPPPSLVQEYRLLHAGCAPDFLLAGHCHHITR